MRKWAGHVMQQYRLPQLRLTQAAGPAEPHHAQEHAPQARQQEVSEALPERLQALRAEPEFAYPARFARLAWCPVESAQLE